jgi:hypothetical protein
MAGTETGTTDGDFSIYTPPSVLYISAKPDGLIEKAKAEMTPEQVYKTLGVTIKGDRATALNLHYNLVNNYSEDRQQNIAITGPSSSGKTYLVLQLLAYHPQDAIIKKGYVSPSAFFHENANLCMRDAAGGFKPLPEKRAYVEGALEEWLKSNPQPERGAGLTEWKARLRSENRRLKDEWSSLDKVYVANFERKILVFLDEPNDALLVKLRPMLSHDAKVIESSITDKQDGRNQTKNVVMIGFPSFVFNSVSYSTDDQERTRFVQLSPSVTQDKLREALNHQAESMTDPGAFSEALENHEDTKLLKWKIWLIANSPTRNVIISPALMEKIRAKYMEGRGALKPRDLRDFPHLVDVVRACALFNQHTRVKVDERTVEAEERDLAYAVEITEPVLEANRLGMPPHVHEFWVKCLEPALKENYLNKKEISQLYARFFSFRIGDRRLKNLIDLYMETGLIYEDMNPVDKRYKVYFLADDIYNTGEGVENSKNAEALINDLAEFFADRDFANIGAVHAATTKAGHKLTQDGLLAFIKGKPELFEVDGWGNVAIKEADHREDLRLLAEAYQEAEPS